MTGILCNGQRHNVGFLFFVSECFVMADDGWMADESLVGSLVVR